jgi:hypothetical protein
MGDERDDIAAERQVIKMREIACRRGPTGALGDLAQDRLGHILDPGEAIHQRVFAIAALIAIRETQRTVRHQNGGGAMAHHFAQGRIKLHFKVKMGVDVQQARHHPFAMRLDNRFGLCPIQIRPARRYAAVLDGDVLDDRSGSGSIKHQPTGNHPVPLMDHGAPPIKGPCYRALAIADWKFINPSSTALGSSQCG